jgi:hypothetical protein
MRINEILTEEELTELNWRKGLATAALGAAALGSMGNASARVVPGDDPGINRLTGKPNTELSVQADRPSQAGAEMPNQNLPAVDNVERTESGITITQDSKLYDVKVLPKGSPTPRGMGTKMMKVNQAQLGERGIGNYVVYLLNNGTAYLYK